MSSNPQPKHARYKCQLNSSHESACFEVRSREIIIQAADGISAQSKAQQMTGLGVVEVTRLDD